MFNKTLVRDRVLNHSSEPLPNDAIYLTRVTNFDKFLDLVDDTVKRSGKSVGEVCVAINKNLAAVKGMLPFADAAIDLFLKYDGNPPAW